MLCLIRSIVFYFYVFAAAKPIIESKPLASYNESWEEMSVLDYSEVKVR